MNSPKHGRAVGRHRRCGPCIDALNEAQRKRRAERRAARLARKEAAKR